MRGNIWMVAVVAFGAVMLYGSSSAVPSNPTNSTQHVNDALQTTAPFVGQLLLMAAAGALLLYAIRV